MAGVRESTAAVPTERSGFSLALTKRDREVLVAMAQARGVSPNLLVQEIVRAAIAAADAQRETAGADGGS